MSGRRSGNCAPPAVFCRKAAMDQSGRSGLAAPDRDAPMGDKYIPFAFPLSPIPGDNLVHNLRPVTQTSPRISRLSSSDYFLTTRSIQVQTLN
jgi:hypothetical protein